MPLAVPRSIVSLVLLSLLSLNTQADTLTVAVAANFAQTFQALAQHFEQQSGHSVVTSLGSTGKLYTQIHKGAPYDLFLAADSARPTLLAQAGLAGQPQTYAVGQLVLWRKQGGPIEDGRALLARADYRFLAIANPKTAPYGRAAQQVLEGLGLWAPLQGRLVRGENITQAYQYVASGNAELGMVALSHVINTKQAGGHYWRVPQELHDPIEQQAVLLARAKDKPAAQQMMAYLASDAARQLITGFGYGTQTPAARERSQP